MVWWYRGGCGGGWEGKGGTGQRRKWGGVNVMSRVKWLEPMWCKVTGAGPCGNLLCVVI